MTDPLKPSASLLCKLGSVIVHAEEFSSEDGHTFDKIALDSLMHDAEVKEWMVSMRKISMIPEKRNER